MKLMKLYEAINPHRLYHHTDPFSLLHIIRDNTLIAMNEDDWDIEDDGEYDRFGRKIELTGELYVSFTRNRRQYFGEGGCRLILNRDRLKNHYKIVPYQDTRFNSDEYEERIYSDVKPLDRYLVGIEILNTRKDDFINDIAMMKVDTPKNVAFVEKFI